MSWPYGGHHMRFRERIGPRDEHTCLKTNSSGKSSGTTFTGGDQRHRSGINGCPLGIPCLTHPRDAACFVGFEPHGVKVSALVCCRGYSAQWRALVQVVRRAKGYGTCFAPGQTHASSVLGSREPNS